jgi:hypothetical protein
MRPLELTVELEHVLDPLVLEEPMVCLASQGFQLLV